MGNQWTIIYIIIPSSSASGVGAVAHARPGSWVIELRGIVPVAVLALSLDVEARSGGLSGLEKGAAHGPTENLAVERTAISVSIRSPRSDRHRPGGALGAVRLASESGTDASNGARD